MKRLDLKAWREQRKDGEEFVTPSGLGIRVKRVSLLDLAEQGAIPDGLSGMVDRALDAHAHSLNLKDIPGYGEMVNRVVMACVVEPAIVDDADADADHLGVNELPLKDRVAIYNWANAAAALVPFRSGEGEPTAA